MSRLADEDVDKRIQEVASALDAYALLIEYFKEKYPTTTQEALDFVNRVEPQRRWPEWEQLTSGIYMPSPLREMLFYRMIYQSADRAVKELCVRFGAKDPR